MPPPYFAGPLISSVDWDGPAVLEAPGRLSPGRGLIENLLRRRYVEIIEYQESQSN